jgi:hypothetical protein
MRLCVAREGYFAAIGGFCEWGGISHPENGSHGVTGLSIDADGMVEHPDRVIEAATAAGNARN